MLNKELGEVSNQEIKNSQLLVHVIRRIDKTILLDLFLFQLSVGYLTDFIRVFSRRLKLQEQQVLLTLKNKISRATWVSTASQKQRDMTFNRIQQLSIQCQTALSTCNVPTKPKHRVSTPSLSVSRNSQQVYMATFQPPSFEMFLNENGCFHNFRVLFNCISHCKLQNRPNAYYIKLVEKNGGGCPLPSARAVISYTGDTNCLVVSVSWWLLYTFHQTIMYSQSRLLRSTLSLPPFLLDVTFVLSLESFVGT